jgi:hypothetical protein
MLNWVLISCYDACPLVLDHVGAIESHQPRASLTPTPRRSSRRRQTRADSLRPTSMENVVAFNSVRCCRKWSSTSCVLPACLPTSRASLFCCMQHRVVVSSGAKRGVSGISVRPLKARVTKLVWITCVARVSGLARKSRSRLRRRVAESLSMYNIVFHRLGKRLRNNPVL